MPRLHTGKITDGVTAVHEPQSADRTSEPFTALVLEDMAASPRFRAALWQEILDSFRAGDTATSKSMLRKYFPDVDIATLQPAMRAP